MRQKLFKVVNILLTVFLPILVFAQNIKIEDLSVSDSLAIAYFLDCKAHPDTVRCDIWLYDGTILGPGEKLETCWDRKDIIGWFRPHQDLKHPPPKKISGDGWSDEICDACIKRNWCPVCEYMLVPRKSSASDFRNWFLMASRKIKNK